MAAPIDLHQLRSERDVAPQLRMFGNPELAEAFGERVLQRALSADDQPPAWVPFPQPGKDVGDEQGVLLGIEPPDGQQRQLTVVRLPLRLLGGGQIAVVDERDGDIEDAPGAAVAIREIGTDDDDPEEAADRPECPLEEVCGGAQGGRLRVPIGARRRPSPGGPENDPPSADLARTTKAIAIG